MKKKTYHYMKIFVLILIAFSCKKVQPVIAPVVKTLPVNEVTGTMAVGGGEVVSDGGGRILMQGVCWDTVADPVMQGNRAVDSSGSARFEVALTGLAGGTHYYARAFAKNAAGVAYGESVSFTTCFIPTVTTRDPIEITDTSATVWGAVTEDYGVQIIAVGMCWDLSESPTINDAKTEDPLIHGVFKSRLTGLLPDTVYHVRSYVTTVNGDTGYGNEVVFRTKPAGYLVYSELIRDVLFEKGFALTPLDPATVQQGGGFEKTYVDTLDFGRDAPNPVWMVAQWHSKYDLAHTPLTSFADGAVGYVNEGKKVILYPDHSLWLEVDASKEYDHARENGEPWPHLLIAQSVGEHGVNIGDAERLDFSMELRIEKCENLMDAGTYDPALHTAQSPFYFLLINDNENSADYNQKLWFGLPSFDYRYSATQDNEMVIWDVGTGIYIYSVPESKIWGRISFQDGQWHSTHINIKPLIQRALTAMRSRGVFKNTSLEDLKIKDMNFGWEVPGTFDAALQVKGISLQIAVNKEEE